MEGVFWKMVLVLRVILVPGFIIYAATMDGHVGYIRLFAL